MCFLPKSRASIDQAPGPIIAKVPPRVANMMATNELSGREKATQTSTIATSVPTAGVHKPTRRAIPAPAPIICGRIGANCGPRCGIP
jgi:hypothetical protein